MFFGSTPVYENDYKRYLWDGSVVASGENPYRFSPLEVFEAGEPGASSVPDLARLAIRSNEANYLTGEINSATLTTIYPPAAQVVFAAAYWIAPYEKWGLKLVFLIIEILGFAAIIAGLRSRNLPLIWSSAYWLNPIIIFTTYNGIHMDVLLVAPLMAALLWIGRHPIRAAIMLSLAAAVKIWPLLLALLTLGASAYFARFKIGEAGHYDIYTNVLLPLEFGIPLLVLAWDGVKARRHA